MNPFYEKKEQKLNIFLDNNMDFPAHLHGHVEILLIKSGQIEVTVAGNCRILSAGDCAVIFPEEVHSYRTIASGSVILLIFDRILSGPYVHSVQKLCPAYPFIEAASIPSDVLLSFERLLELTAPKWTGECFNGLENNSIAVAEAWIHVALAHLVPLLELREKRQPESIYITDRLLQYIMEHYQEPLTLEILARELHVNKYYLSHIFSDRLQMNFRQYLNRIRLDHALLDISMTDHSLNKIWEEAGFNSQRSFNRFFLDTMGMTPVEYRKAKKSERNTCQ